MRRRNRTFLELLRMNETVAVPDLVAFPDAADEHPRRLGLGGFIVIRLKMRHMKNVVRVVQKLRTV